MGLTRQGRGGVLQEVEAGEDADGDVEAEAFEAEVSSSSEHGWSGEGRASGCLSAQCSLDDGYLFIVAPLIKLDQDINYRGRTSIAARGEKLTAVRTHVNGRQWMLTLCLSILDC